MLFLFLLFLCLFSNAPHNRAIHDTELGSPLINSEDGQVAEKTERPGLKVRIMGSGEPLDKYLKTHHAKEQAMKMKHTLETLLHLSRYEKIMKDYCEVSSLCIYFLAEGFIQSNFNALKKFKMYTSISVGFLLGLIGLSIARSMTNSVNDFMFAIFGVSAGGFCFWTAMCSVYYFFEMRVQVIVRLMQGNAKTEAKFLIVADNQEHLLKKVLARIMNEFGMVMSLADKGEMLSESVVINGLL